jgi:hypothetical protein
VAKTTPGETTPEEATLEEATLEETTLGETTLGETTLGETSLEETSLGETSLGETTPGETALNASPSVDASPAKWEPLRLNLDGFVLDESTLMKSRILPYVRMVVSVLEGRKISRKQLVLALRTRIRQRSIGRLSRREYVLDYLNRHPP